MFNPRAYGCPTANSPSDRSSGNHQQSPRPPTPPPHPLWILGPRRNPPEVPPWEAGHSGKRKSASPSKPHKQSTNTHRFSSPSPASNEPVNVGNTSQHIPKTALSTTSQGVTSVDNPAKNETLSGYPAGFSPYAYGHPTASPSSQEHSPGPHLNNPPAPALSRSQSVHTTNVAPEISLKEVKISGAHPEQPQAPSNDNATEHKPTTSAPSRPLKGTKMAGTKPKPPPATYETLKKAGETPEQVIARLQMAGTREVGLRMRRKAKGEPINTGLNILDLLRNPPAPDEVDHDEAFPTEVHTLLPRDPNTHIRESHQGGLAPAEKKALHCQEDKRDIHHVAQQSGGAVVVASKPHEEDVAVTTDTAVTPVPPVPSKSNRRRWATAAETKPPSIKPDSNAEGSEDPESDDDSIRPMGGCFGRLVRSKKPPVGESSLRGWDGNMQPPPLDWEFRPRFHNNTPEYLNGFDSWLGETTMYTMNKGNARAKSSKEQASPNIDFGTFPVDLVRNPDNHADGIGFVSRSTTIQPYNTAHYPLRQPGEVLIDLVDPGPADFEARSKLDLRDNDTREFKDETAQMFIDRRMMYLEHSKKEAGAQLSIQQQQQQETRTEDPEPATAAPTITPVKANIYLRPAVRSDFAGMAKIYNWHISNGIRPSELREIDEQEMEARHDMSVSARLPVIVAVERHRKNAHNKPPPRRINPNHPIQNIDPTYTAMVKDENVVGWACATDWSAKDYVETITAEIEIYVAAEFRQQGVGRCLMDALLDATDRGYNRKGGYSFHVAPEMRHMYTTGGGRDLHKVVFQVRSFNKPFTPAQVQRMKHAARPARDWGWDSTDRSGVGKEPSPSSHKDKDFSKEAKLNDREDDYTVWLKGWLESFGFEEEAFLKKIGTKHKRFVDVRYLTRETCWQPAEHKIQDFSLGL